MKKLILLFLSFTLLTALASEADLSGIKDYLLGQTTALKTATAELQALSDQYYTLAESSDFDYRVMWQNNGAEVTNLIEESRAAWMKASPLYEGMEGIVAGTPSLAQFDVDLDAGTSAEEDPEGAVSFDITLPNGEVLVKPGNLFGVTESTLYGTYEAFSSNIQADLNDNEKSEFGEVLPDANVLKGGVDLLAQMSSDLDSAAQAWEPTESDAFTALAVMVPTMSEYFGSWRDSRFVTGEASTQRDFVAISRLADIQGILGGLQIVHQNVSPLIQTVDPDQDTQIAEGLESLKLFVKGVYDEEQAGKTFTPEEADLLGAEAQNRATAITGQIVQVASQLNITIEE